LPHGDSSRVDTCSNAADDPTDDHLRQAIRAGLDGTAQSEPHATKEDSTSTANAVTNESREYSTNDTSQIVSRYDLGLDDRVGVVEGLEEELIGEQAAEDTLIITEQQEARVFRSD
jgi:hypothetical protein